MIFSWQQSDWKQLSKDKSRLHHGLLISGQSGIGKREFALALCQYLLCSEVTEEIDSSTQSARNVVCGQCQNCQLFAAGSHPDLHVLSSELEATEGRLPLLGAYSNRYLDSKEREKKKKYSRIIAIDQVRELIERFTTHAHISSTRVALILPADCLNINAANALLKLLEEPPPGSIFILVTANPSHLPATIRSRCMTHNLIAPDWESALALLAQDLNEEQAELALTLANGCPLEARQLVDNGFLQHHQQCLKGFSEIVAGQISVVDLAAQLNKLDFEPLLLWLHRFVARLIKCCVSNVEAHWPKGMGIDVRKTSVERLYRLYDRISYYRRIAREPLNEQLALEDLLLTFQRVVVTACAVTTALARH